MVQLGHSMILVQARSMDPGSRLSYVAVSAADDRRTDGSDVCRMGRSKAQVHSRQVQVHSKWGQPEHSMLQRRVHSRMQRRGHSRMELHTSLQEHMSHNWIS